MSFLRTHAAFACFAALALIAAAARADESRLSGEQGPGLTLAAAVSAALARNPDLQASSYSLRAADARIEQAGFGSNPELSIELENFGGDGRVRGFNAAETTFALSQVIELGGKRSRRVDAARDERSLLDIDSQARQLDVLAEVTRRFIHVASDQEQMALIRRATQFAEKTVTEVERRVKAARSPEVELHRARVALARARVEEEHAEHELLTSRRKLAAMWGEAQPGFDSVSADLHALPALSDFEALQQRLAGNPDFTRFASEARLRDAELRLAQSKAVPSVRIGAGLRRLEETGDQGFVASLSMPLMLRDRNAGAIAEAEVRRDAVAADRQAALIKAQAQLFELYQELRHSITEAQMLRDEVLPGMEEALRQTEYAYRRGRYSYLEWMDAQRELLGAHRDRIEAAANAHRYLAEIERLTGEALAAPAP